MRKNKNRGKRWFFHEIFENNLDQTHVLLTQYYAKYLEIFDAVLR